MKIDLTLSCKNYDSELTERLIAIALFSISILILSVYFLYTKWSAKISLKKKIYFKFSINSIECWKAVRNSSLQILTKLSIKVTMHHWSRSLKVTQILHRCTLVTYKNTVTTHRDQQLMSHLLLDREFKTSQNIQYLKFV